ncbi:chemotaxis protein CheD [Rhodobacterales bacterium HKCCE4037]|nr:chemotaxis protein CheD [Rhodobacterales bacterium HKCCE4037]
MTFQTPFRTKHIIQGEYFVTDDPNLVLSTLLGSCVAACFRDPALGMGGINHFLLPGNDPGVSSSIRYGAHAMEQLINAMLRRGARRHGMEVWLFGGANVLSGMTQIGDSNAKFARKFVHDEGFKLRGEDLGGTRGRKVRFHPATGRFEVTPLAEAIAEKPRPRPASTGGEIELF